MLHRKEAKDCFICRNAGVFYSKARIPCVLSGTLR